MNPHEDPRLEDIREEYRFMLEEKFARLEAEVQAINAQHDRVQRRIILWSCVGLGVVWVIALMNFYNLVKEKF